MINLLLFIFQLIILFLLARSFSKHFFRFWFILTKSKIWSIRLMSVFLLPGTLIHELSHWLVAEILQVPTGKMSLMPEVVDGSGVKLGSVQIARTDVFRRTLIGLAPLLIGLVLIGLLVLVIPSDVLACRDWNCGLGIVLPLVGVFLVSNTMFSSKKDLEAAFVPFGMGIFFGFAACSAACC